MCLRGKVVPLPYSIILEELFSSVQFTMRCNEEVEAWEGAHRSGGGGGGGRGCGDRQEAVTMLRQHITKQGNTILR